MSIMKRLRALPGHIAVLCLLSASSAAQAGNGPLRFQASGEAIQVRFEPASQETRVTGRIAPQHCFSFSMPQEWRARVDGAKTRLESVLSHIELEVGLRSAQELKHMPQSDLASRDAALLQRDYEELLGRPAQSVSFEASTSGATRWSATWIDAHLPAASHAITVETFIVPLSDEWVLELSLSNVERREAYNALVQRMLTGLSVLDGAACGA